MDAFEDASGIDASASTNELRNANKYVSGGVFTAATGGTITTYTLGSNYYKVHTFTSGGTFTAPSSGIVDILAVAGGARSDGRGVESLTVRSHGLESGSRPRRHTRTAAGDVRRPTTP